MRISTSPEQTAPISCSMIREQILMNVLYIVGRAREDFHRLIQYDEKFVVNGALMH